MRHFAHTFFLAAQEPNGYYVLNDVFRYLKDDTAVAASNDAVKVAPQQYAKAGGGAGVGTKKQQQQQQHDAKPATATPTTESPAATTAAPAATPTVIDAPTSSDDKTTTTTTTTTSAPAPSTASAGSESKPEAVKGGSWAVVASQNKAKSVANKAPQRRKREIPV